MTGMNVWDGMYGMECMGRMHGIDRVTALDGYHGIHGIV